MITINPKEKFDLEFDMKIDGHAKNVQSVSIILEAGEFSLKFPATYQKNTVNCVIPVLDGIISEGQHSFTMEIVVDGKLYTPLAESLLVESPVKISANISKSIVQDDVIVEEEPEIKVSLSKSILGRKK